MSALRFYIPDTRRADFGSAYEKMIKAVEEQLKVKVSSRRVFSLSYTHDKKSCYAEVGQLDQQENRYKILAIFESKPYIVCTVGENGQPGPSILVSHDEVTEVKEFD